MSSGSRGMYVERDERRRSTKKSGRDDENPGIARQRMAAKSTRTVYSSPMPSVSAPTAPRPTMARPIAVSSTRYVGVVDQWFGSNGFVIVPALDTEILFLHVNDLLCDEKDIVVGATVDCMVAVSNKVMANGRAPRRMAVDVKITEPITRAVEAVVQKADEKGNAWLKWEGHQAYFRNRTPVVGAGDKVSATIFDAPKGLRATGVVRMP